MSRHPFDGHRVYNGCPDDTMQARLNEENAALARLIAANPKAHLTYFPVEGKWLAHTFGDPLSGMHANKLMAIEEALKRIGQ